MTYKDHFVVEIKCKGKILRMKDDAVHLPFGSEYSILLKNLNSRKASIKIHIDSQDVLDYSSLILEPNGSTELEGFLSGTVVRNKFKFIQKTKEIQDHRGDKVDDGLVRVEFAFEKAKPEVRQIITERHDHYHYHHDYYHWWPQWTYCSSGDSSKKDAAGDDPITTHTSAMNMNVEASNNNMDRGEIRACFSNVQMDSLGIESLGKPLDDEGITVKGSDCHQSFRYGSIGELEQSQVIVVKLKGITQSGNQIQTPVTVRTKLQCSSCGKRCRSSFKFCPNCGTFLE